MRLVRISPMTKLLPGMEPEEDASQVVAPRNGHIFFQVAYCGKESRSFDAPLLNVTVKGSLPASVYRVELVPCTLPAYPDADDGYLTKTPCLMPDRLVPCGRETPVRLLSNYWQTVWVEVYAPAGLEPGEHSLVLRFSDEADKTWGRISLGFTVQDIMLPEQTFLHTQWLHLDCICQAHHCQPFSHQFWMLAEAYLRCQVEHGINVAWVPIFTPPLDTAIGGARMTIQLVEINLESHGYRFDFGKLDRWLTLCQELGFGCFEFSHLFTQWGAGAAPKIMAWDNGVAKQIFGWNTPACGPEYTDFLRDFLPALRQFLHEKGIYERCMFHISDEPTPENAESYRRAKDLVQSILPDIYLRDTLSNLSLYQNGLIEHPISSISHAAIFQAAQVPDLWTYYSCVDGGNGYSNCFLAMPLSRVRVLAQQAISFGVSGFLHWAFNFWNTQLSREPIDPNVVTDAGGAFPSGDAFLVYPGPHGPLPSLRLKMLAWAMEDIRASGIAYNHPRSCWLLPGSSIT